MPVTTESIISRRQVTQDDEETLYEIYASTRQPELAAVPWTAVQKEYFLRSQFTAQNHHFRTYYADSDFQLILRDGAPAGRLYVFRSPDEIRVVDIALLPEHRGLGIGSTLLRELQSEANESGLPVTIHVEQFNPARRLYERLGFQRKEDVGVYDRMEWVPPRLLSPAEGAVSMK